MEVTMTMRDLIPWGRNRSMPAPQETEVASPFRALHQEMNRLFDDFFDGFKGRFGMPSRWSAGAWPHVEVRETEKEVKVVAELPGMGEKDVELTLRDGVLTLKGEKQAETNGSVYSERWHGSFERSIDLGPDVDPDKVTATFKNGVLTVTLGKRPEAQSQVKRIPIKA
jgi:HSP20 family protein